MTCCPFLPPVQFAKPRYQTIADATKLVIASQAAVNCSLPVLFAKPRKQTVTIATRMVIASQADVTEEVYLAAPNAKQSYQTVADAMKTAIVHQAAVGPVGGANHVKHQTIRGLVLAIPTAIVHQAAVIKQVVSSPVHSATPR